jgi:hypothetical protein
MQAEEESKMPALPKFDIEETSDDEIENNLVFDARKPYQHLIPKDTNSEILDVRIE